MMATPVRPNARRGPSGAWNRLKAPPVDALEVYGLPSKGETRLNDPKAQETYYNKIVERYVRFCAATGNAEELAAAFETISMEQSGGAQLKLPSTSSTGTEKSFTAKQTNDSHATSTTSTGEATPRPQPSSATTTTTSTSSTSAANHDLSTIHLAMRKLRESLTATRRTDTFAQRAYIFIIHATILTQTWEAYQPALLYLLYHIHPHTPLTPAELGEHVGYYMLDLGCRQQAFGRAMGVRRAFCRGGNALGGVEGECGSGSGREGLGAGGQMIAAVLRALVHDDWVRFWRLRRAVDGYARAIMGFAEQRMRLHVLKCLGRSYLSAERRFVERVCCAQWEDLVEAGCGWELSEDGCVVVIRRPRGK